VVSANFSRHVFINCPFDPQYAPLLQAILFCVVYLGFLPRIASENSDSAQVRLQKISALIKDSKYSIHDLSRSQAHEAGEYYRLNMPFELGMDYGCREFGNARQMGKRLLILEEKQRAYQAALSDLAGCDAKYHNADFESAIRQVRNWLVANASAPPVGATRIVGAYTDFQEWYYEKQLAAGFSEDDIQDYPTSELLAAMTEWTTLGKPL
jgi:hypothetical protein